MFNRHDGGKGDKPILPKDAEQFDKNWDAIFKKQKQDKQYSQEEGTESKNT